jgi:type II secretory pathway component GspD/PulD (secretin)
MKTLIVLLLALCSFASHAEKVSIRLDRIPLIDFINVYYTQLEKTSYVVSPEVYEMEQLVGVSYSTADSRVLRSVFLRVLRDSGVDVDKLDGVDFIRKSKSEQDHVFVYRPKYRAMSYFADLLSSVFPNGRFSYQRDNIQTDLTAAMNPQSANVAPSPFSSPQSQNPADTGQIFNNTGNQPNFDVLVFSGSQKDVIKLEGLVKQLDIPVSQVQITAYLYEFTDKSNKTTGLAALANIAKGDLRLNASLGQQPGANFLSFGFSGGFGVLNLIAQQVSTDSRFKVLSRPYVRVKSGSSARFTSGADVPVLGAVQFNQTGNAVQSVDYKPSGVILDVLPRVHDEVIDLDVGQQLSNFVNTQTGVNNSPTLTKREVRTSLTVKDSEVIAIGGLFSDQGQRDHSLLFGLIPVGNSDGVERSEIIVLLEVQRLDARPLAQTD